MTNIHLTLPRLAVLASLVAAPLPAVAQPEQRPPAISVTGEATINQAPDLAVLQAGVTSQARTARDAMSSSARLMAAVLIALKDAGVSEKDIQTSELRLDPIRDPHKNPSTIIAVEATSLVTVHVREVGKSAEVLDRMISAGANVATGIGFVVSEPSKLLDQARAEAVADARRKAEIYAKAAGVSVGRPLSISEGYISRARAQTMARREAVALPIQAGEEKIGINVSVSFEMVR